MVTQNAGEIGGKAVVGDQSFAFWGREDGIIMQTRCRVYEYSAFPHDKVERKGHGVEFLHALGLSVPEHQMPCYLVAVLTPP
jgi:hypothetical protein